MDSVLMARMKAAAEAAYPIYRHHVPEKGIVKDCRTSIEFKTNIQQELIQKMMANYSTLGVPAFLEELEKKHNL